MLSRDELREILKVLHKLQLPAELGAVDEEDDGMGEEEEELKKRKKACACDEEEHT